MFAAKNRFLTNAGGGYQITNSLRLRSSASAYLVRTMGVPTSTKTFTLSFWMKRGQLGTRQSIWNEANVPTNSGILSYISTGDVLSFSLNVSGTTYSQSTSMVFRDPSAWYHIVYAVDTTQATAANRAIIYVNGVTAALNSPSYPNQNDDPKINSSGYATYIGIYNDVTSYLFDGYLAEYYCIDGQALTPSSFGAIDANGVWSPSKYTGTYGNNGFYLKFTDNSGATATTIGKDYSGNGNNWTPNNISVTAGVTYDSMIDSPTNAASATQPVGNYCTWNPLAYRPSGGQNTLSNGNLRATGTSTWGYGTVAWGTTGKYYVEFKATAGTGNAGVGLDNPKGSNSQTQQVVYYSTGQSYIAGTLAAYGSSYTTGDVIGMAVDAGAGTVTFYKNNVSQGAITTTVSNCSVTDINGAAWTFDLNCGQQPFTYTPPSGYQALCTSNLTTPTISNGALYMAATTYTGTGATQTIANTVNSANFQPDLVWIKSRSAATNNNLFDAIRGTTNYLISNSTAANASNANTLTAFGSTGFTLGSDASSIGVNVNTATYVGWQWLAGAGTTSSNTNGSITSTVCVNTTSGFSVVTYTGTGANATVGHGLGVAPSMVIVKQRTAASTTNWAVWHTSIANTNYLLLNTTAASTAGATYWNSTTPTSSVFSLGSAADTNTNTGTYVAYCFAPITGYSAFGSYTGNGSTDGPFVYCGFRPKWVMTKMTTAAGGSWVIQDDVRTATYNPADGRLVAETAAAEDISGIDLLANGFKIRNTSVSQNNDTNTRIYAAFAENPFNYSRAR